MIKTRVHKNDIMPPHHQNVFYGYKKYIFRERAREPLCGQDKFMSGFYDEVNIN